MTPPKRRHFHLRGFGSLDRRGLVSSSGAAAQTSAGLLRFVGKTKPGEPVASHCQLVPTLAAMKTCPPTRSYAMNRSRPSSPHSSLMTHKHELLKGTIP